MHHVRMIPLLLWLASWTTVHARAEESHPPTPPELERPLTAGAESAWVWIGPEGGPLGPFVFSPADPERVLAASANGVFRSLDGGGSWTRLASGLTDPNVTALVSAGDAVLAGTRRHGLFRSVDRGDTWQPVDLGIPNQWVLVLAADPADPSRIYAGTADSGVFRSEDGGATWTVSNDGLDNLTVGGLAVSPLDSDVIYAAASTSVFRSLDGGNTWSDLFFPFEARPPGRIAVQASGEPLVASFSGLLALEEQGWANLLQASPEVAGPVGFIALHPTDPAQILVDASPSLIRSRDGGQTWRRVTIPNIFNVSVRGLAYHPADPATIFAGTAGGTFVSADSGSTWQESLAGLRARALLRLAFDPINPLVMHGSGVGGAFKTVTGARWEPIRGELDGLTGTSLAVDAADSNLLLAGSLFGVYRSRDAGLHWDLVVGSTVRALGAHPSVPGLVLAAVRSGPTIFGPSTSVLRSRDADVSWEDVTGGFRELAADLLLSRADPDRVLLASVQGVFFSSQSGGAWVEANEGLADRNILTLEEGPDGAVYAGSRFGRVFRSPEAGGVWTELTRPTTLAIQDLAVDPDDPAVLYAATDGEGLFESRDGGAGWAPVEGLESPYVRQVRFSPDGRRLLVAGQGGVYQRVRQSVPELDVSIVQEVSTGAFPRSTVRISVRLSPAAQPAGAEETVYRYQQALPLGLRLVEASASSGEVFAGPAFDSVTWSGALAEEILLEIAAEVLDGTAGRDLATQGVLTRQDDPLGARALSDDPDLPGSADPSVIAIGASPFAAGVLVVPRALPVADSFVGFALLNRADSPAQVGLEGIDEDGTTRETSQLEESLPSGAQTARLTSEFLSAGQTALLSSSGAGLEGFFLLGDTQLERLDGVGGVQMDSQRLFLPRVQTTGGRQTYLFLFNPDPASAADVSLVLRDEQGGTLRTARRVLPPRGSIWAPVPEVLPGPDLQDGTLQVDADRPLRGFGWIVGAQTFETLPGLPVQYADRLWSPHAFFGEVGTTRLRLLNTGAKPLLATVRYFDDGGGDPRELEVLLSAGELRLLDLSVLGEEAGGTRQGWLEVTAAVESAVSEWPSWLAVVEYQSADGSTASTLPLVAHPSGSATFLQVAQSRRARIFQGLALADVGPLDPFRQFPSGTVIAFESAGPPSAFGNPFLTARNRVSGLLDEPRFFGEGFEQERGYLEVLSARPVVSYTLFGGARFLSAVEAQLRSLFLY